MRIMLVSALVAAAVLVAGEAGAQSLQVGSGATASSPAVAVKIDNFTFNPPEITIEKGATVTWTNTDDIPHTVTASNMAFRSKVMDTDQSFSFTFAQAGKYEYFCSLHPHMKGMVLVH